MLVEYVRRKFKKRERQEIPTVIAIIVSHIGFVESATANKVTGIYEYLSIRSIFPLSSSCQACWRAIFPS